MTIRWIWALAVALALLGLSAFPQGASACSCAVDAIGTWLDGAREDGDSIPPPRAHTPSPPYAGVRA